MQSSFESPASALAGIAECLEPWTASPVLPNVAVDEVVLHIGSKGSGQSLLCCDRRILVRIEEQSTYLTEGQTVIGRHGCLDMQTSVHVIYRECWSIEAKNRPKTAAMLTSDGLDIMGSAWDALTRLRACTPSNSRIKFVAVDQDGPEAGCIGWTMQLIANTKFCTPASSVV